MNNYRPDNWGEIRESDGLPSEINTNLEEEGRYEAGATAMLDALKEMK